jgi:hypothetical protein
MCRWGCCCWCWREWVSEKEKRGDVRDEKEGLVQKKCGVPWNEKVISLPAFCLCKSDWFFRLSLWDLTRCSVRWKRENPFRASRAPCDSMLLWYLVVIVIVVVALPCPALGEILHGHRGRGREWLLLGAIGCPMAYHTHIWPGQVNW